MSLTREDVERIRRGTYGLVLDREVLLDLVDERDEWKRRAEAAERGDATFAAAVASNTELDDLIAFNGMQSAQLVALAAERDALKAQLAESTRAYIELLETGGEARAAAFEEAAKHVEQSEPVIERQFAYTVAERNEADWVASVKKVAAELRALAKERTP